LQAGEVRTERTFAQDDLAQDGRTGSFQPRDDGRVEVGHEVGKDLRTRHGANAPRVTEVFHRDGHAMERPAVPAGRNLGIRAPSTRERSVGHDGDVALQASVHRGDSVEQLSCQVQRLEPSCCDELADVRQTRVVLRISDLRDRSSRQAAPARHRGDRQYRGASQTCQEIAARQRVRSMHSWLCPRLSPVVGRRGAAVLEKAGPSLNSIEETGSHELQSDAPSFALGL
jgi:hypothetical protein